MASTAYRPAQPQALRDLNRKFDLDPKNMKKKKSSNFTKQFKESAERLVADFGRKSTIHGMARIFQKNSNKYER